MPPAARPVRHHAAAASVPLLLLAACTAAPSTRPAAGFIPATRPAASSSALVGNDARGLQRMFGKPRLDIRDPTARKLQFSGSRCVLDAYLYPPGKDREPLVTYAEARAPTGAPVDADACARMLRGN